jgi:predicted Zn-dependent peptidase
MAGLVNKRLNDVVREELSGTYSIGVYSDVTTELNPRVNMQVFFECEPGREDELIEAVYGVIEELQEEGIPQAMVNASVAASRRQFEQAQTNNSYWLGIMSLAIDEGGVPDEFLDWERLLELTTVEKIQELAKQYLTLIE